MARGEGGRERWAGGGGGERGGGELGKVQGDTHESRSRYWYTKRPLKTRAVREALATEMSHTLIVILHLMVSSSSSSSSSLSPVLCPSL